MAARHGGRPLRDPLCVRASAGTSIPREPPPIGPMARGSRVGRDLVEVTGYLAWLEQQQAGGASSGGADPMRSTTIGAIDMGLAQIANDLRATADGTAIVTGPQYLILNTVKTGDPSEGRHWITVIYELVPQASGGGGA